MGLAQWQVSVKIVGAHIMSSWPRGEEMDAERREGGKKRVYYEQGSCPTLLVNILLWKNELKSGQTVYGNSLLITRERQKKHSH